MGTIKLGLQEDFKEEEEGKEMLLESWRIDCLQFDIVFINFYIKFYYYLYIYTIIEFKIILNFII